jgi:tRNA-binding protein
MLIGTIIDVQDFPQAKNPSYKIKIDFGEYGMKKTSAQLTQLYSKVDLLNKQVVAVTNFPTKQVATTMSECLIFGVYEKEGVVLLNLERPVTNGLRVA